jgi:transcriptional regulator with PAS, ATPase and Fis domain
MIKENYETIILSVSMLACSIQEHAGNYYLCKKLFLYTSINSICLDAIIDGAMIIKNDTRIIQMNSRCEKTLGYSIAQIPYLEKINQIKISFQKNQENFYECHIKIRSKEMILTGNLTVINGEHDYSISLFSFGDINLPEDLQCSLYQSENHTFNSFIGKSPNFLSALEESKKQSFSTNSFLIWGEAGVGKERLARTIHHESSKRKNNFIKVSRNKDFNEVFYDTLDYKNLEPNDAHNDSIDNTIKGCTIYLDEVGVLNHYNQEKLLSLLGSSNYFNFKIICSSTCDLIKLVNKGDFIKDLYYALELNSIYLPPLRNRNGDVILLAEHYLRKYNSFHKKNLYFSKGMVDLFLKYSWHGNIIELENTISFIVQAHDDVEDEINKENIPVNCKRRLMEENKKSFNLESSEKEMIINALNEVGEMGKSKKLVAEKLGISMSTLYRKLKYYNIMHISNYD